MLKRVAANFCRTIKVLSFVKWLSRVFGCKAVLFNSFIVFCKDHAFILVWGYKLLKFLLV